ncbi:carbohydrate ABC transporter permease [Anaerobium acetethylicum]|uniref:Multiple sugar transport system permease protein/raffinose/stachyose/melibiose transport system permease protein n=1 Tax=Anaerobium acetethylicum TaxID=1619234 RepID=A0A1D3TX74_9FIRM|nr:sugar ABC transporter permease [Anaerobium acetethylicum]SCP98927.1 multiple sugar transport system permease protein/raffinose/stachyose/melibiose transport system permease protein [Anaerobium acetethylicum]
MYWLSKKRYIVLMLIPTLLIYIVYMIAPIIVAVGYSFTKYSGIGNAKFIGLNNYIRLLGDSTFMLSLKNTMVIFVVIFIFLMVGAFSVALLLNNKLKFNGTAKALIFSPAIIAPIIVGIIWVFILDPEVGLINSIMNEIGLEKHTQLWIGGDKLTPYCVAFIYLWQQLGYVATIFIAGLKMIPEEVMEAAKVDGANAWQKVRYVTIPMIRSTISTAAILIITGTFKIFEVVQQLTNGGPNHVSETLVTYSYATTFSNGEYGYGMSMATITFIISLMITAIYSFFAREKVE